MSTDIIDILASFLVWSDHSIVAVDAGWHARPDTLAIVAGLDHALAAGKSVLHSLALALVENSWVSTLSAGHWLVILVLSKAISQTVTDEDGLQVDVALLVGKDLGGEDWDVVTSVRLSGNVEVLFRVFWELLEE